MKRKNVLRCFALMIWAVCTINVFCSFEVKRIKIDAKAITANAIQIASKLFNLGPSDKGGLYTIKFHDNNY